MALETGILLGGLLATGFAFLPRAGRRVALSAAVEFCVGVLIAFGMFRAAGELQPTGGLWWILAALPVLVPAAVAGVHRLLGRKVSRVAVASSLICSALAGALGCGLTFLDVRVLRILIYY